MKLPIFKTVLHFSNGTQLPITIAAAEVTRIEGLVAKNAPVYNRPDRTIARFTITEVLNSYQLSDEKYDEEITFCDIVEEI